MKLKLSYSARRAWAGRAFIGIWALGVTVFFLIPLVQSFFYTFYEMIFTQTGMDLIPIGLENYQFAFVQDPYFLSYLGESMGDMVTSMPLILLFSLFAAVILNRKFKGRGLVRSVFFFPVIVTSGALIYVLNTETATMQTGASVMLKNADVGAILTRLLGSAKLAEPITAMMDKVFTVIWKSGVQTLLFLAGLQSISGALYESASLEGASAWEMFWKITVPMVSPILMINVVYTIIDSFTDYNNSMLRYVITCIFGKVQYTFGTTIAWLYFAATFAVLGIIMGLLSRKVFYVND